MIRRVAAVFAFLVVASGWLLAQDSPLPGPAGGFSGGTVPNAVVLTGDNAGGVGTLRIRPSDEDTQLVLCEASNNASPEVCSSLQHINVSSTIANAGLLLNGYFDSAGSLTRYNTSFGQTWQYATAGTTAAGNIVGMRVYGTGGAAAGDLNIAATAAATSTLTVGAAGTVTTDIRGPILNGGSAACNGYNTGAACVTDVLSVNEASTTASINVNTTASSNTGYARFELQNVGVPVGRLMYNGATSGQLDADLAATIALVGYGGYVATVAQNESTAAGTNVFKVMDALSGTAQTLLTVDGDGNLFLNASATRTKGTVTLAAGTGTVTVASGSICTCTDTTAVAAVQCSVATTTLTINGTGTDVIAYHCL